jgi:gamma-glutamyltranspeptidase/glutathione hydrolase
VSIARKPFYGPRGAVATSQPLATAAGLDALRRGGNAVDAAIAAATTLTVVEPGSNGIGGDLFAIVWDGARLHGLNASGRSPAALTLDAVRTAGGAEAMPARGWASVTVPGAPAGWHDLHARFGRLPFESLFADAMHLAEYGFPVSPTDARSWQRSVDLHGSLRGEEFAEWGKVFAPDGRAPRAGERWRNPEAANTLGLIAATAGEAFYRGEVAEALAALATRTGGLCTADDLACHASLWVDPLSVDYHGHQVWELPPNGQGLAVLLTLAILDGVDLDGGSDDAAAERRVHTQLEAMKLGFADAHAYVADPELAPAPLDGLRDKSYVESRRALLGDRAVVPSAGAPVRGGTVYLCTADADGMMVSLIQSNYAGFGSFVAVPGYGFGLQNRGAGFVLDPAHPNVVGPGKRPFHTIIPGFLTRDGEPVGPFGVMGGHMQPQGHVQVVMSMVDGGLDPQAALDAPRWYWESGLTVLVEPEWPAGVVEALRDRGHEVGVAEERGVFGRGQVIRRLPDAAGRSVGYVAGSEPRADGHAAVY